MSAMKLVNFHGFVLERDGVRYALDRAAYTDDDGSFPLEQLRPDEVLVAPGVIYRAVDGVSAPPVGLASAKGGG